jgi:hypothetical protein
VEKVSAAPAIKPKSQRATTETSQLSDEQQQETLFDLAYWQGDTWFRSDGRGLDLTAVPAMQEEEKVNEEQQLRQSAQEVKQAEQDPVDETVVAPTETITGDIVSQENFTTRVIADDTVTELAEGQMRKTEFLQELRAAICQTIEPVLATAGQTTDECPYLNYWLGLYHTKDAAHIERTAKKYAPGIAASTTATEYISIIAQRALLAATVWARTGKITGVPDGVPLNLPGEPSSAKDFNRVQAKAKSGGTRKVDDPRLIQKELGRGQPLAPAVRSRMESAFGMSFAHVRTHTDSNATEISNRANARAFTIGNHIAFGNGEYNPGTLEGDALIAHELTHTAQQINGNDSVQKIEAGNEQYDALEKNSDQTAAAVIGSLWGKGKDIAQRSVTTLRSGLRLQRCSSKTKKATYIRAVPQAPDQGLLSKMNLSGAPSSAQPRKLAFGGYLEFIGWETDGRNGIIVQEIVNTINLTPCKGGSLRGESKPDPAYWEMWNVDGDGRVTPISGLVNDAWVRASHRDTHGNFSINAKVFWAEVLDQEAGFRKDNPGVPTVPELKTTTKKPSGLGTSLLNRNAAGVWDCSGQHT